MAYFRPSERDSIWRAIKNPGCAVVGHSAEHYYRLRSIPLNKIIGIDFSTFNAVGIDEGRCGDNPFRSRVECVSAPLSIRGFNPKTIGIFTEEEMPMSENIDRWSFPYILENYIDHDWLTNFKLRGFFRLPGVPIEHIEPDYRNIRSLFFSRFSKLVLHGSQLKEINNCNNETDCYGAYLNKKVPVLLPWFRALFGLCLYSYGLWQVNPRSNYGLFAWLFFFLGAVSFVYGIYGILRWSLGGS